MFVFFQSCGIDTENIRLFLWGPNSDSSISDFDHRNTSYEYVTKMVSTSIEYHKQSNTLTQGCQIFCES